ncbi:E3 ubiquitin- ligase UBR7, partial [Paramuricea clavata]
GVGKPHDMDNNHMLSVIEQKMCVEDRKIWARELERNEKPASLQGLIAWMETEMKSRMRATAPLRNQSQGSRYVNQLSGGKPPKSSVGVASVENNTEAMLPVITVKISGKNNRHKQGNILLDSGAQISLICTSTAKNLDLKGKDVSITIRKVGGEEEVLATKVYQVPITSLESGAKFTVKAVGIPHISDDISNINIDEMVKGIGIPEVKIYRECGPIDMLIGIDHAYMHTGDSKKVGNVVARHSPL